MAGELWLARRTFNNAEILADCASNRLMGTEGVGGVKKAWRRYGERADSLTCLGRDIEQWQASRENRIRLRPLRPGFSSLGGKRKWGSERARLLSLLLPSCSLRSVPTRYRPLHPRRPATPPGAGRPRAGRPRLRARNACSGTR